MKVALLNNSVLSVKQVAELMMLAGCLHDISEITTDKNTAKQAKECMLMLCSILRVQSN